MSQSRTATGHGETGFPDSHNDNDIDNDNMTASSSPYPSLSPSPTPSDESPGLWGSGEPSLGGEALRNGVLLQPAAAAGAVPGPATLDSATDGLTDRLFRSKPKGPIAAIFIHAGAGFHSTLNEHVHLEACSDAARLAMKFLKAGGTAVDAVEAAIKCLEDKEITNAGFGSNLTIDGIVEGDATIVDHLGRSGACGSVQMIRNPISLARLIYDRSNVPLSLRRIPPNILVGHGATRFAQEHGMCLVPHQHLISKGAQERFCRWRQDLANADAAIRRHSHAAAAASVPGARPQQQPPPAAGGGQPEEASGAASTPSTRQAVLDARLPSSAKGKAQALPAPRPPDVRGSQGTQSGAPVAASDTAAPAPAASNVDPRAARRSAPHPKRIRLGDYTLIRSDEAAAQRRKSNSSGDGSNADSLGAGFPTISETMAESADSYPEGYLPDAFAVEDVLANAGLRDQDMDIITDTIGAIAIDLRGNIAAGSSSGGIGMKHSGRVGPAALVGIGSAVMPVDPKDSSGMSVAAVTSGTGEHMATTMASHTCAERLYLNQRRTDSGMLETEYDEDAIMKAFVAQDFMNHPGVKNQISRGAIGVMAAKKTNRGIYFYFAHNTDSFALASLSSLEQDPLVVISRLGSQDSVARGGRKIKHM